jgi:Mrp family chromosome partitioning ATPase/capsular polysaccharide biosynthesis protein
MGVDGDDIQTREALELRDYLRVIRERFWVIPATVLVVLAVTLVVTFVSTPQYRTSTRLEYKKNNLEQAAFGEQAFVNTNQDREVQTGAELVKVEPVAEAVRKDLNSPRTTSALLAMISVKSKTGSNIIDIYAEGPDAAECAKVANAFADQFVLSRQAADRAPVEAAWRVVDASIRTLSREELTSEYGLTLRQNYEKLRGIEAMLDGGFTVRQRAMVPAEAFSPRPLRDSLVALALGLVAGIGLAFLLDYFDRRVKDEKALERILGAPVLTKVPWLGGRRRGDKPGEWSPEYVGFVKRPVLLEAFRTLRSNLEFFDVEKRQCTWLITSSEPQEGKSTTAVNLALSLALSGKRVVVLDADLRRPMISEYVGVAQAPGLSNLLAGSKRLEDALQLVKADEFMPPASRRRPGESGSGLMQRNIYVLTSGPVPPNPAELLASPRMGKLLADLAGMCDCLLIDAPPVLAVSDAAAIARHADGVIVVARLGHTSRDQLIEVREIFERSKQRVVGAVAYEAKKSPTYGRRRGYGYGYGYGQENEVGPPGLPVN